MGIDLGRLRSPLPISELTLSMIRKLKESYHLNSQLEEAMGKSDFGNFFQSFEKELAKIESVAEQTKVIIVRLEDRLKSVEAKLSEYRKKLKKISRKNPSAKQHLKFVESLLSQVKKIKNHIIAEAGRAIREEGRIRSNI